MRNCADPDLSQILLALLSRYVFQVEDPEPSQPRSALRRSKRIVAEQQKSYH
jgi:hypothetical protein